MENNSEYFYAQGTAAFNASKFEDAVQYFTKALAEKPNDALCFGNRAIAYRQLGDYGNALQDIEKAILLNPKEALFYSTKAAILTKLHRQLEAIEELDKAIKLEPLVEYVVNKVVILKKLNKFQEALEVIRTVESQNMGSEELTVYKGIILFDTGKDNEALKIFESIRTPKYKTVVDNYLSEIKKKNN